MSGGQALAALGAARREHFAAAGRGHARAKAVLACAADLGGLVGAFHCCASTFVFLDITASLIAAEKPYIRARYAPCCQSLAPQPVRAGCGCERLLSPRPRQVPKPIVAFFPLTNSCG